MKTSIKSRFRKLISSTVVTSMLMTSIVGFPVFAADEPQGPGCTGPVEALTNPTDPVATFDAAMGFAVFANTFTQSMHMEGTVAANLLIRNHNNVMDLTCEDTMNFAYAGNFYYYFNDIEMGPNADIQKAIVAQYPTDEADMLIGSGLHWLPVSEQNGNWGVEYNGNFISDPRVNGSYQFALYSETNGFVYLSNDPYLTSNSRNMDLVPVNSDNAIDFNSILGPSGLLTNYSLSIMSKQDTIANPSVHDSNMTFEISEGTNYITLNEEQINNFNINFVPVANVNYEDCNVVINVVDSNGDRVIDLTGTKPTLFNGMGEQLQSAGSAVAASSLLFNFGNFSGTVRLGQAAKVGSVLAPNASVILPSDNSTHDGNIIANTFENRGCETHQKGAFRFKAPASPMYNNSIVIRKSYVDINGNPVPVHGNATFTIYRDATRMEGWPPRQVHYDEFVATAFSADGITYRWTDLPAGDYIIKEDAPVGFISFHEKVNAWGNNCDFIPVSISSDGTITFGTGWYGYGTHGICPSEVTINSDRTSNFDCSMVNTFDPDRVYGSITFRKIDNQGTPVLNASVVLSYDGDGSSSNFGVTSVNGSAPSFIISPDFLQGTSSVTNAILLTTGGSDITIEGLTPGAYTLSEPFGAPAGYEVSGPINFVVTADGNIMIGDSFVSDSVITMVDELSPSFEIAKVDNDGVLIEDALLTITNIGGQNNLLNDVVVLQADDISTDYGLVSFRTNGTDRVIIRNLPNGSYILTETEWPSVYSQADSIQFSVLDGVISGDAQFVNDNVLTMVDNDAPFITINKVNSNNDLLGGALLQITLENPYGYVDFSVVSVYQNNQEVSADIVGWPSSMSFRTGAYSTRLYGLPDGDYVLTEIEAPTSANYQIADPIHFSVSGGVITGSANNTLTMTDLIEGETPAVPETFDVTINKVEVAGGPEIGGATLTITSTDTSIDWASVTADRNGAAVTLGTVTNGISYETVENQHTDIHGLPAGTYVLTETTVPGGYEQAEAITFVIDENGKITVDGNEVSAVEMIDERTPVLPVTFDVTINKVEVAGGPEIGGATLTITSTDTSIDWASVTADRNGAAVTLGTVTNGISYETVENQHTDIHGLPAGTYVLTETTVPGGYEQAEAITFVIDENGKITVDGNEVSAVEMIDERTPVTAELYLDKVDSADTTALLGGASFTLTYTGDSDLTGVGVTGAIISNSANSNVITFKTVTDSEVHFTNLPVGSYVLTETGAPEGYDDPANPTTNFVVEADGSVTGAVNGHIVIENTATPVVPVTFDVTINKVEAAGGPEIGGATLTITSTDTSI
ncbi:MAG: hypothetical protein MJ094_06885, partial [Saccharofermentans sp.]|nr:hypothetical protein [Saccharofermentans sp.]